MMSTAEMARRRRDPFYGAAGPPPAKRILVQIPENQIQEVRSDPELEQVQSDVYAAALAGRQAGVAMPSACAAAGVAISQPPTHRGLTKLRSLRQFSCPAWLRICRVLVQISIRKLAAQ